MLELVAWTMRPVIEAELGDKIARHYRAITPGLPAAQRVKRLAEIDKELSDLLAAEEQLLRVLRDDGMAIERRPDADAEAMLGLRD